MAKFIIHATIIVEGGEIKTKQDAINEIDAVLDCYDDMSALRDASVSMTLDTDIKRARA